MLVHSASDHALCTWRGQRGTSQDVSAGEQGFSTDGHPSRTLRDLHRVGQNAIGFVSGQELADTESEDRIVVGMDGTRLVVDSDHPLHLDEENDQQLYQGSDEQSRLLSGSDDHVQLLTDSDDQVRVSVDSDDHVRLLTGSAEQPAVTDPSDEGMDVRVVTEHSRLLPKGHIESSFSSFATI